MKQDWKQEPGTAMVHRRALTMALLMMCISVSSLAIRAAAAAEAPAAAGHDGPNASPPRIWSLAELVEELKQHNPQLEQGRQAYLAAQLQVPQANTEPGAQLGLLEQANTGGPFDFNHKSGFFAYPSLTQPFLWPGKLQLAGEIAQAQAEVVGRQYDSLVIQLVSQLKLSYYQLVALQDQLHFMDEDLQRLEQLKEVSKVRYANNADAYVDFLNAQVAASSLENDRFALSKQIQQQTEQINNLLGHASQTALSLQGEDRNPHLPASSLDALIEMAQQTNPVVAGGESQILAADKSVQLAHKSFLPDFAFSAGGYTDPSLTDPGSSRLYSIGVNVTLPTWGFRKERALLDQTRAQLDEAKAGQTATLQAVDLNVANAYHSLETALQQIQFIRTRALPQAQMAYRLGLVGYGNNGGTAFSDLLTAQSSLRSTELSLVQAQNTAVQAYVSLAAAIGKDPE